ncbi:hypothetical protein RAH42_00085 [Pyramidobacter sp. YE332]|uniref:hypothetical protein n=1 Tax=Pyramidobacter sp. YE332 TaxID=3068894 RepID=UPI00294B0D04|nr:hypothetical protein [Pyramidobacter sp. YE332]WOL40032.1 hypothetical protein RAH42_12990 [Pyramidobacter sp. YE332]WOL40058.1 hypothetical protein RAH42_00085 [Pyramidobacter sp. YE332]
MVITPSKKSFYEVPFSRGRPEIFRSGAPPTRPCCHLNILLSTMQVSGPARLSATNGVFLAGGAARYRLSSDFMP